MKVLIVGATGNTGRLVTPRLLAEGHDVTAFARQPAKLTAAVDRLRLVQGDVRDPPSLESAVMGQDAVIATFGPRTLGKTDVQEVFMRNLVAAMEHCDVRRLVNLSAWGSGGAAVPPRSLVVRYFLLPILLRHLLADKQRGETHLAEHVETVVTGSAIGPERDANSTAYEIFNWRNTRTELGV